MAINMITGLPGNAKTLFAISFVKPWAERENRPVFYSGIKDCLIPGWTEIDPVKWTDCPTGSIIFIDEAQKTFRNRSLGSVSPYHVTELEEHRHRGVDFVMITQHPGLLDPAVRKLTQTHRHMVRVWGMEVSTVHLWDGVRENCDKPGGRKDSQQTKWAFDKSLYGLYHSADLHTVKRSVPLRAKLLLLVPIIIGVAFYFAWLKAGPKKPPVVSDPLAFAAAGSVGPVPDARRADAKVIDPVADAKEYVRKTTPRVVGLPHTAPKYDELTVPVRVPVPAACMAIGSLRSEKGLRCKCYSQQGTPMQVEYSMCLDIARNGYFQDFDPDPQRQSSSSSRGEEIASHRASAVSVSGSSSVTVIPDLTPGKAPRGRNG